ncbi:MAG: hypothetical protein IH944_14265 [Armatimonadetes bacterium]|nr:hypothetical protein [Armatimonadota bacterium]
MPLLLTAKMAVLRMHYPGIVALTVSLIGPGSPLVFTHRPMMCTVLPPSAPSNDSRCGVRVSV